MKINFHNSHSVYMHDTPVADAVRAQLPRRELGLRAHLRHRASGGLADVGAGLDASEKVLEMKKSGERLDVKLKKPVPLYFAYITAWATEDGVIQFRRDLYNKDGVGAPASAY